jgi:hypothetical protein
MAQITKDNRSGSEAWTFILYENFKGHVVPTKLLPLLQEDLRERFGPGEYGDKLHQAPESQRFVDTWGIDLPGMLLTSRKYHHVSIPGLDLEIPCQDAEYFLEDLQKLEPRKFSDGTVYYKLHGWLQCIVLTEENRQLMIADIEKALPAIREQAEADRQALNAGCAAAEKAGKLVRIQALKNDPVAPGTPLSGAPTLEKN